MENVTFTLVCLIRSLEESQETHEQSETVPELNKKYKVNTLNNIVDNVRGYLGKYKILLDYAVHYEPAVIPEAYNPSGNHEKD